MKRKIFIIAIILLFLLVSLYALAPKTSNPRELPRYSLNYYKSLRPDTPFSQVIREIGQPDADVGSGIHIFVYKLPDGSEVLLGYPNPQKLIYAKQRKPDGSTIDLLPSSNPVD